MIVVLRNSWALLLGMLLLLLGNGLQGTVLGIRGGMEGFDPTTMSVIMSAYYIGLLIGSRSSVGLIRRVGHVRVFAALTSLISAAFIIYAAAPNPVVWAALRLLLGFCFAGVYVTAESWLNEASTNETRGQALSLYMIVQTIGIIAAQFVVGLADPGGYTLFVVMSVLVSIAMTPILLSVSPAPVFSTTAPMSLSQLFRISPLGCVGTFLLGGVFAGIFSMSSVFGVQKGLSIAEIAGFVAATYTGGLVFQFPVGWASDRMDRRKLILGLTAFGALFTLAAFRFTDIPAVLFIVAFFLGAVANPLYSLIIAYTNDFLDHSDMAAASGGLLFIHGLGAVSGPLIIGWLMTRFGADAFFVFVATLFGLISLYAGYRMTKRPSPPVESTSSYTPVMPQASPVAMEVAQELAIERAMQIDHDPEKI